MWSIVCANALESLVKVDAWTASTSSTGVDATCSTTATTWRRSCRSHVLANWSPRRPRSGRRLVGHYSTHSVMRALLRSSRRLPPQHQRTTTRSSAWAARCSYSGATARPVTRLLWPARCALPERTIASTVIALAETPGARERLRTCLGGDVRLGWSSVERGKDARAKAWWCQVEPEDAASRRQSAAARRAGLPRQVLSPFSSRQNSARSQPEPRCYSRRTTFESSPIRRLAAPKVGARPLFFTPRSWEESFRDGTAVRDRGARGRRRA